MTDQAPIPARGETTPTCAECVAELQALTDDPEFDGMSGDLGDYCPHAAPAASLPVEPAGTPPLDFTATLSLLNAEVRRVGGSGQPWRQQAEALAALTSEVSRLTALNERYLRQRDEINVERVALHAEVSALREAVDTLRRAGSPLSNLAVDLAQKPGLAIYRGELDSARRAWDAATAALAARRDGAP